MNEFLNWEHFVIYGEGVEATSRCEADLKVKSYFEVRFFRKSPPTERHYHMMGGDNFLLVNETLYELTAVSGSQCKMINQKDRSFSKVSAHNFLCCWNQTLYICVIKRRLWCKLTTYFREAYFHVVSSVIHYLDF